MAIEHPSHDEAEPTTVPADPSKVFSTLKWQGPPVTLEDMQVAIEEGAVARYKRAVEAHTADDEP